MGKVSLREMECGDQRSHHWEVADLDSNPSPCHRQRRKKKGWDCSQFEGGQELTRQIFFPSHLWGTFFPSFTLFTFIECPQWVPDSADITQCCGLDFLPTETSWTDSESVCPPLMDGKLPKGRIWVTSVFLVLNIYIVKAC